MFDISVATTSRLFGPLRLLPVALGMPFFHPIPLMNTNKSASGVNLGHMWRESRDDRGLDANTTEGRRRMAGSAPMWTRAFRSRQTGEGANLSGRPRGRRQGRPDDLESTCSLNRGSFLLERSVRD